VPDPSERCTTAIACDGSLALGLSLAIAGSFQVLISPRKILDQAVLRQLVAGERRVGGAEGHGLGLDLLDAAARADRLIVQADIGLLLIGVRPLGVNRIREGGAGTGDVGRHGGHGRDDGERAGRRKGSD
jgi:hypothetical protein